ncbi:MAG: small ribosomal subunit biogenesis GTPase RsgA [Thiohalomonadaceae bacterium]
MSKRKLTRQQAWRIEKIQQERQQRSQRKAIDLGQFSADLLGPEQEGLLIANYGAAADVASINGDIYRCHLRQNLPLLVAGDRVAWQEITAENTGIIIALLPRHSLLSRPDALGQPHPLAANVDQILIVTAPRPIYSTDLIDQYLVAAESTGITPLIVLNKTDLISTAAEREEIEQDLQHYQTIGYTILHTSTYQQTGLDSLRSSLQGQCSVFVGQSGVGKSSLISAFLPQQTIRIGGLTEHSGHGRHTTSTTRYYPLPEGGAIIDAPGVREFSLWHMSAIELAHGFIEFRPYLGRCHFRDCSHRHEPGCALQQAVADGQISTTRLASYHRMNEEDMH